MPENNEQPTPIATPAQSLEDAARSAVAQTKRVLSSMVERIYDSQKKLGIWTSDEREPETEDFVGFLMDAQAKIVAAYHAYTAGESDIPEAPRILIDVCIDLLGGARRFGVDVGELFVDGVVVQATLAATVEKEDEGIVAAAPSAEPVSQG